jgi:hypothetical protein
MTVNIRAADNRRHLSIFSLEPDFGILERTAILAYDISLDRGSLRSERRPESERTCEKKIGNKTPPRHQLIRANLEKGPAQTSVRAVGRKELKALSVVGRSYLAVPAVVLQGWLS